MFYKARYKVRKTLYRFTHRKQIREWNREIDELLAQCM